MPVVSGSVWLRVSLGKLTEKPRLEKTRRKIEVMLAKSAVLDVAEFQRGLQVTVQSYAGATMAFALDRSVLDQNSQGAAGAGLPAIDAIVEVSAPADTLLTTLADRLTGLGDRLNAYIDRHRSGILAGTEFTVMPGEGPVSLFCPLRRLDRLDRLDFQRYWLDVHAEFGRRPGYRYRQFHSDNEATKLAAKAAGIPASEVDGVALAYYNDIDHLRSMLSSPDIAQDAFADEQRFIDHATSQFLPFTSASRLQR